MKKKVLWERYRRTEFKEAVEKDAVVILALGSIEQHGTHLPVNTDINACFEIAKRAAEQVDDFPVLVLPPMWMGYSQEHMMRPGAISFKYNTYVQVLTEIAECVYSHGFTKLMFLNGHGGNLAAASSMRIKLAFESKCPPSLLITWFRLPSLEMLPNDGHSGPTETAVQLYLQPELVDKENLKWAEGVFGDPSLGTRERGEEVIRSAVDDLAKVIVNFHEGKINDGWGWSEEPMVGRKEASGTGILKKS
jgi:creatinine amidohydrolase